MARLRLSLTMAFLAGMHAFGLEDELLTFARYVAADCERVPAVKVIGTFSCDATSREIHRLLWEKPVLDAHLKPLIQGQDLEAYSRRFLQLEVTAAEESGQAARRELLSYYESVVQSLSEAQVDLQTFYLMRRLSLLDEKDYDTAATVFRNLSELLGEDTLPHRIALVAAAERYLSIARLDRGQRDLLEQSLMRDLASAAVHLVEVGAFQAARAAVRTALKRRPSMSKVTAASLLSFVDRREKLWQDVSRLHGQWQKTQEGAREWAMLLLSTFRRHEEAFDAMKASDNSTLEGLVVLLQTQGGLKASAEVINDLAAAVDEPAAAGLQLLALDLYGRASPLAELPQAKQLRPTLDGKTDPLLALKLTPTTAHAGVTVRVLTDPPTSYVYVDNMLQAIPGSLVQTPCTIEGLTPEKHRVVAASLKGRDITFSGVLPHQGLILAGMHKSGKSSILAKAGRNLFLRRKISVKGVTQGQPEKLFDGDTACTNTRKGFAAADWPCLFTVTLPRPTRLTALRFKFWDKDQRTYNYTLEISPDGRTLYQVVDRSKHGSSSWQNILFPAQKVRVIRIHGLKNTANSKFHLMELEGYEIARPDYMKDPIVWR